jgi:hypothetical protein
VLTAHQPSRQRLRVLALAFTAVLGACASDELAPSIWPPSDFALQVEEVHFADDGPVVTRRFRVFADGLVVYATSSRSLTDAATGVRLPVLDRLSVYRLVPTCLRGLSRRIEQLAATEDAGAEVVIGAGSGIGLSIRWTAFGSARALAAQGRVRGAVADAVALVTAHLPPGEAFGLQLPRAVVPVLRGVPLPVQDAAAALAVFEELWREQPTDEGLMLDAFVLACDRGDGEAARRWLQRWSEATAAMRARPAAFADELPRLDPEALARFVPAG